MTLAEILRKVRDGDVDLEEAERAVRLHALSQVEQALKLDVGRHERTGVPEVVLAEGKRPDDVVEAARALLKARGTAILSRVEDGLDLSGLEAELETHACGVVVARAPGVARQVTGGRVAVLSAGASDVRVAEEAEVVAHALGCEVAVERDVGVASLARAVAAVKRLTETAPHAWVVVAGREGALAPVVAGLVPGPVIGVPVSTGYGYAGRGEAALSTMLQACTPLLTVNIDAGFVAGAAAAQVANRAAGRR